MNTPDELLKIIKEKAVKRGEFVLSSGKKSDLYVDCKQVLFDPDTLRLIGKKFALVHRKEEIAIHALCGMAIGGIPIITMLSLETGLSGFFYRRKSKEHGSGQGKLEGILPNTGSNIILVEDVVTTSESILLAAKACRESGYCVAGIIALIDRQEGGRLNIEKEGYGFYSIFTKEDLI